MVAEFKKVKRRVDIIEGILVASLQLAPVLIQIIQYTLNNIYLRGNRFGIIKFLFGGSRLFRLVEIGFGGSFWWRCVGLFGWNIIGGSLRVIVNLLFRCIKEPER